ncbi:hypothetical protein OF83DRAFT_1177137 [Amylostereum chailletii]|nr:hypothetical protein OF83DRAFT_1177137 [Amylostereum chailletii]
MAQPHISHATSPFSIASDVTISEAQPPTRDAAWPLSDNDADIVLRSSESLDFRVHRWALSRASSIFTTMFSLPQPSYTSPEQTHSPHGLPIVCMSEDEPSLDLLLRFCYPRTISPEPSLEDLQDLKRALAVGRKFQIDVIVEGAKRRLIRYAEERPDAAFVLAWTHELRDVALIAARKTLRQPFLASAQAEDFVDVPGLALFRLISYQNACIASMQELLPVDMDVALSWITHAEILLGQNECVCKGRDIFLIVDDVMEVRCVKDWWWAYVQRAIAALERKPHASALTSALVYPSFLQIGQCPGCSSDRVVEILDVTGRRLKEAMERKINDITLETPF